MCFSIIYHTELRLEMLRSPSSFHSINIPVFLFCQRSWLAFCSGWFCLMNCSYYWMIIHSADISVANARCHSVGSCPITSGLYQAVALYANGAQYADEDFECIFVSGSLLFYLNFIEVCFPRCSWWQFCIDSGNGLAPNRRQAITCTIADPVHWRIQAPTGRDELTPGDITIS